MTHGQRDTGSVMDEPPFSLLQQRGIEAEVLIPLIRRLEHELGREQAHRIARETIEEIARKQGASVASALGRNDLSERSRTRGVEPAATSSSTHCKTMTKRFTST